MRSALRVEAQMSYATNETYKVTAVAPSGAKKVIAKAVGAFKATRLKAEIERRGLAAEITAVYVLRD
jgi:hypothetical protein